MPAIRPSPEMYLKSLFELASAAEPVSIAAVAAHLGVTPVSASEMIHRLERNDLVVHRRYQGVRLTKAGREHAIGLIRRHRLWECFLHSDLGLSWAAVHDLACELEHAAPDSVTERLARRLSHPVHCPHGNPIPAGRRRPPKETEPALSDLEQGEAAVLVSVHPESTPNLTYLAAHGLLPGKKFRVERIESTDRLYLLRHAGGTIAVGPELAGRLHVRRLRASHPEA